MPLKPAGRICPSCNRHYVSKRGCCDRCEAGYRMVLTSEGWVELLLPLGINSIQSQVVISALTLGPEASAADFVRLLLASVARQAAHVPERHRTWLSAALHSLLSSSVPDLKGTEPVPLARLPHAQLGRAIYLWLNQSHSLADELPLLPYFRAEAARFVRQHYEGALRQLGGDNLPLYIQGSFPPGEGRSTFSFLDDRTFKSAFTRRHGGVEVRGMVPKSGRLALVYREQGWKPGQTFEFRIQRCQLSSGWEHYVWLVAEEPEPRLDIFNDFAAYGTLVGERGASGKVPFAWFTHQKVRAPADPDRPHDWKWEWAALPDWMRASPEPGSPKRRRAPRL